MKKIKFFSWFLVAMSVLLASSLAIAANAPVDKKNPSVGAAVEDSYHPTRIIIKFKDKPQFSRLLRFSSKNNLQKQKTFKHLGMGLYTANSKVSIPQLIQQLKKDPMVEYAEPDYRRYALAIPNDPRFIDQWGLHNTQQIIGSVDDVDIDAPEAWDLNIDTSNIVVAVVDSGIDYTHPDLEGNMWINPGEIAGNGIDDDGNGYIDDIHGIDTVNFDSDPMDDNNHGTHVAGIIGAVGDNAQGVSGVNWSIKLMALKFLDDSGSGFNSGAIELLDYITAMRTQGVNLVVVNHSWGGAGYSQALRDAINQSAVLGVTHVAASGNSGMDNDTTPMYPASYDIAGLISVASISFFNQLSTFSNYGLNSVDIAAPGSSILSTVRGGGYGILSGTSMAAPFVAGSAAQLFAQNPARSVAQVKARLMGTADVIAPISSRIQSGRLNLHQALTCVEGTPQLKLNIDADFLVEMGQRQLLTASVNDCGTIAVDSLQVTVDNGLGFSYVMALLDDGGNGDVLAADGIYSVFWSPASVSTHTLDFAYTYPGQSGGQQVIGEVVISAAYEFDAAEPFQWQDISTTGTPIQVAAICDDCSVTVPSLPFPISFYGLEYSTLYVSSNGVLNFHGSNSDAFNKVIPNSSFTNSMVAPFWDDLNPQYAVGNIRWQSLGSAPHRQLIIQYENVPFFEPVNRANGLSFQAIFEESSNDIVFQYRDVQGQGDSGDFAASATIGLQRDNGYGQQYSFNQSVLQDEMAIRWHLFSAEVNPSRSVVDYGEVALNKSATQDISLINFSNETYTVASVLQSGADVAAFDMVLDECTGVSILPGDRCNISMIFTPLSIGVKNSTLQFTPVDVGQAVIGIAYLGDGIIVPDISVQSAIPFNNVVMGQSQTQSLLLSNLGSNILNISSISVVSDVIDVFSLTSDCSVVAIASDCLINVTFTPESVDDVSASLVIMSDDPDSPMVNMALQGSVILPISINYLTADFYGGMAPLDVNFNLLATGGSGSYLYAWDFDDGTNSSLQNPSHQFAQGSYDVAVTITDANNAHNTLTSNLPINAISPLMIQSMSADRLQGVAPLAVNFTVNPVGGSGNYSYLWVFADGSSSTLQSPSHTYTNNGDYDVQVTITDTLNTDSTVQSSLLIKVIDVGASPVIIQSLSADALVGVGPLSVQFAMNVDGGSGSYDYQWDFADGTTSIDLAPSHSFTTGSYTVKVTVSDQSDADNVAVGSLSILVVDGSIVPLVIQSLGADKLVGNGPLTVQFNLGMSGGSGNYNYLWNFADGSSSTGALPEHLFGLVGSHNVTVTITDQADASNVAVGSLNIIVLEDAVLPLTIQGLGADQLAGVGPLAVQFNLAVSGGSGEYNYGWNFSDGTTSSLNSPSHIFNTLGSHSVTVTITDMADAGNFAVGSLTVLVVDSPVSPVVIQSLGADHLAGVGPLTSQFSLILKGGSGSYSYLWDFGDSTTSTEQIPSHIFDVVGTHTISVTITDQTDVSNFAIGNLTILVVDGPVAPLVIDTLGADQLAGVGPLSVQFSLGVTGGSGSYDYGWNFSDGSSSNKSAPLHLFNDVGSYTVTVTITDQADAGNFAVGSLTVLVVDAPVSPVVIQSLGADKLAGVGPLSVQFNLTLSGGSGSYNYLWDFADGTTSSEVMPAHVFTRLGSHSITVSIMDQTDSSNVAVGNLNILVVDGPVSPVIIDSLGADQLAGIGPLAIQFNLGLSGGSGNYDYAWDFADGTLSNQMAPAHTFNVVGSHTVTITITDQTDSSNYAMGSLTVLVVDGPVSPVVIQSLGADKLAGVGPLSVQFSLTLNGGSGSYNYLWDFADGTSSSEVMPSHLFMTLGSHAVSVTIIDQTDSSNKVTGHLNVVVVEGSVKPVIIHSLGADQLAGVGPLAVQFNLGLSGGSGSYDYAWDFADGTSSNQIAPAHTFNAVGSHTITVTITDQADANNYVRGGLIVLVVDGPVPPVVIQSLGADKLAGVGPLSVQFSLTLSGGSGSYNYLWNFSDGTSSSEVMPSHLFTELGSHGVSVTITDQTDINNKAVGHLNIVVVEGAVAPVIIHSLGADQLAGVGPLAVQFNLGLSGGSGDYDYVWDFADGTTSHLVAPAHTFNSVGSHTVTVTIADQADANNYAKGSLTVLIVDGPVSPVVIQSIGADKLAGVGPLSVQFSLTLNGGSGSYNYLWDFADGANSSEVMPSHLFTTLGSHAVSVTITDQADINNKAVGHLNIVVVEGSVKPVIIHSLSADQLAGVGPLAVQFNLGLSGGSGSYDYVWDFADGTTSHLVAPAHTFNSIGSHMVTVTITDQADANNYAKGSLTVLVVYGPVSPVVIQSLGADKLAGVGPLSVQFSLTLNGGSGSYNYLWDFADGTTSTEVMPSHLFTMLGSHGVSVRITDQTDADNVAVGHLNIVVVEGAVAPVIIHSLGADQLAGVGPLSVQFNLGLSGGSGRYDYAWDFADGIRSNQVAPSHTFNTVGSHTVIITIRDQADASNFAVGSLTILVLDGPASPLIIESIGADKLAGVGPLSVQFNLSLSGGSGSYRYQWKFADGSVSSQVAPMHLFDTVGSHEVVVTITDQADSNNIAVASLYILVVEMPIAPLQIQSLGADQLAGMGPLTVQFDLEVIGGSGHYNYTWKFAEGITSQLMNPLHVFSELGSHTVIVTITDQENVNNFAVGSLSILVIDGPVSPLIIQSLGADKLAGVGPLAVQFNLGISGGSGRYSYLWEFSDGSQSTHPAPSHTFSEVGSHAVSVVITDLADSQNIAAGSLNLLVISTPEVISVSLLVSQQDNNAPAKVTVTASMHGGSAPYSIYWDFGDGETLLQDNIMTDQQTIQHTYNQSGSYVIVATVTAMNAAGSGFSSRSIIDAGIEIDTSTSDDNEGGAGAFNPIGLALLICGVFLIRRYRTVVSCAAREVL